MTQLLVACLIMMGFALGGTVGLLVFPIMPGELQLWHALRIQNIRKWITRTRNINQPLHENRTLAFARTNLWWHLTLTTLFCILVARATALDTWWICALASLLVAPSGAYFLGSLVQRQKIAILKMRGASSGQT
jgi:hypothetical protein